MLRSPSLNLGGCLRSFKFHTPAAHGGHRHASSGSTGVPQQARVVICGGGIAGLSAAYNLAKLGLTDVVLLEQGR